MLNKKLFWYINMASCIPIWIFLIYGIVNPFQDKVISIIWLGSLVAMAIGHPIELIRFWSTAKENGIPAMRTVVMVLIFGFTWWLPVKKGIFEK